MRNIFAACLRWWGALSKFAHGKQINKNENNTESNLLPNLRPSQMISAQLCLSSILNLRRRKRQMLRVLKEYLFWMPLCMAARIDWTILWLVPPSRVRIGVSGLTAHAPLSGNIASVGHDDDDDDKCNCWLS